MASSLFIGPKKQSSIFLAEILAWGQVPGSKEGFGLGGGHPRFETAATGGIHLVYKLAQYDDGESPLK